MFSSYSDHWHWLFSRSFCFFFFFKFVLCFFSYFVNYLFDLLLMRQFSFIYFCKLFFSRQKIKILQRKILWFYFPIFKANIYKIYLCSCVFLSLLAVERNSDVECKLESYNLTLAQEGFSAVYLFWNLHTNVQGLCHLFLVRSLIKSLKF